MKGTRLYKPAGSPLIQGHSRRERPALADVTTAALVTVVLGYVFAYVVWGDSDALSLSWSFPVAAWLLGTGVASGFLGVWVAKHFGWHPRWIAGASLGTIAGSVCLWVFLFGGI